MTPRILRRLFVIFRPLGLALATFILLNLVLALGNPQSSATRVWLNLDIPEPALSIFAGILGLALLVPHDAGRHSWMRWLLGGVIFGFFILVGANVIGYYHRIHLGHIRTALPVPFSMALLGILFLEFARISWWGPMEPRLPPPAWLFVRGGLVVGSFFLLISIHIVTFGNTDYRRIADAAVVLGAKVHDNGRLSPALTERVKTGAELYHQGLVSYLIMTGGTGPNGISEPESMAVYAQQLGVPLSKIILDGNGINTRQSARNCGKIARENGFARLLTVSQSFHCARVKLIFERAGTHCFTVPAGPAQKRTRLFRGNYHLLREVFAFPFYFLYYS